jgi:aryl-alcohol dehydrogenase-like predicted oxidoreductase
MLLKDDAMEYLQLGKTEFTVSPICLGTAQFGANVSREDAFWQLDAFVDMGGNIIDTAKIYNDWVEGEKSRSEKITGDWLRSSTKRDKVVIMTKGAHPFWESMNISRCTPDEITIDIDDSLHNLGVECIDMYLLHRDNPRLPVALLLDTLEVARRVGKIKHYGFSNWTLPRILEAEVCAKKMGIEGFTCNQVMWSLAEINVDNIADKTLVAMDREMYDWHCASKMSATFYSSTANGWFSKLEKNCEASAGQKNLYENNVNKKIYERLQKAFHELGLSALEISLAYLKTHPFPSLPVTSFSKREQLLESMKACKTILPQELVDDLNVLKRLA